jgi:hypothetical protein
VFFCRIARGCRCGEVGMVVEGYYPALVTHVQAGFFSGGVVTQKSWRMLFVGMAQLVTTRKGMANAITSNLDGCGNQITARLQSPRQRCKLICTVTSENSERAWTSLVHTSTTIRCCLVLPIVKNGRNLAGGFWNATNSWAAAWLP